MRIETNNQKSLLREIFEKIILILPQPRELSSMITESQSEARSNFRIGLTNIHSDLDYIAFQLASVLEADDLDNLIARLQEKYSEKVNKKLEL